MEGYGNHLLLLRAEAWAVLNPPTPLRDSRIIPQVLTNVKRCVIIPACSARSQNYPMKNRR